MIENIGNLFAFIGGLGMFLYGMNIMADGLQKSAGNKMKQLLGYLTNNKLLGVLIGALVTAIIQSSSATTVMVVGFVNAGILTLTQAAGVIMGANVGTTITAWLVSASEWGAFLKPEFIAPLILGIGAFALLFVKGKRIKQVAEIAIGFGILFIGLSSMSAAVSMYRESPIFAKAFSTLGANPILGIITGAVVTAIIQSSSASVGILQTLALNGIVNWRSAIFITLGQNIGTCVTALLSSAGANKTAKRAAIIHLLFNVSGAIIFGVIMTIFFFVNPNMAAANISSTQISIFHTIFNVSNTVILFPFVGILVKLSYLFIKGEDSNEEEEEDQVVLKHLDDRILEAPTFAVESAIKEVVHMGEIVLENVDLAVKEVCLPKPEQKKIDIVLKREGTINNMEKIITEYLVKISRLSLTEQQNTVINNLFYTVSDIERIGDHAENLAEFAQTRLNHEIVFSEGAMRELAQISEKVESALENAMMARTTEDMKYVRKVIQLEDEVDELEEVLREKHIARLSKGECTSETGVIFLDVLSNLERISDHAINIVEYIREERN
ncbi:MAG: Na/Pi cotransporter family protein [Lachnospiraceae bacterium]